MSDLYITLCIYSSINRVNVSYYSLKFDQILIVDLPKVREIVCQLKVILSCINPIISH